jgi:hypothetical protein
MTPQMIAGILMRDQPHNTELRSKLYQSIFKAYHPRKHLFREKRK